MGCLPPPHSLLSPLMSTLTSTSVALPHFPSVSSPSGPVQLEARTTVSRALSAVVIMGLKLRFLIAPMRSYYLLIRSFWDQHQTDNNNKHSLHWNSVMTLPACGAMGRGIVWVWKSQATWGGISRRFGAANKLMGASLRFLAARPDEPLLLQHKVPPRGPSAASPRTPERELGGLPTGRGEFLENDLVSCVFLQAFSHEYIHASECVHGHTFMCV